MDFAFSNLKYSEDILTATYCTLIHSLTIVWWSCACGHVWYLGEIKTEFTGKVSATDLD